MKLINKYLTNESLDFNLDRLSNVDFFLFDFDSVIVVYDQETEELKVKLGIIDILQRRKRFKKDFVKCAKDLGYNLQYVKKALDTIKVRTELNEDIFKLLKKLKELNKHIIIASNNCPLYIKVFMDHFLLNEYVKEVWTPEDSNWSWKPDREYYYALQKSLNKSSFNKMLLIDDEKENIEIFKALGGNAILYDEKRIPNVQFNLIRIKSDAVRYYHILAPKVTVMNLDVLIHSTYEIDKVVIKCVDGDEVRRNQSHNFQSSGNDLVYDFIPSKTIWIDQNSDQKEWKNLILHELIERYVMEKYKIKFELAHNIAEKLENDFKKKNSEV